MAEIIAENLHGIIHDILADYKTDRIIDKMDVFCRPDKRAVIDILDKLVRIIFPGYFKDAYYRVYSVETNMTMLMEDVAYLLNKQIAIALPCTCAKLHSEGELADRAQEITLAFFRAIPKLRAYIELDVRAAFEGDPAASSEAEIIYSYPGLYAICVHRLAHELHVLGVPVIPRIMSEHAHNCTGVDIHPGATIGRSFFIDHATGVVVGETAVIGDHVKLYQGVTIGALSTRGGQKLKGAKRHPTIENNVTIYSGASILGGETVVGHDSVIGGNSFITRSIKPGTRVSIKNQELQIDERDGVSFEEKEIAPGAWFYTI